MGCAVWTINVYNIRWHVTKRKSSLDRTLILSAWSKMALRIMFLLCRSTWAIEKNLIVTRTIWLLENPNWSRANVASISVRLRRHTVFETICSYLQLENKTNNQNKREDMYILYCLNLYADSVTVNQDATGDLTGT